MSDVIVAHLVRKANGPAPVEAFLRCFYAFTNARLALICKGFTDEADARAMLPEWAVGYAPQVELVPDVGFDIGSYRRAAPRLHAELVCFCNSFSRPLVSGWLDRLTWALEQGDCGLVGCTGSLEGIPGSPFPNPHVRTNAFIMRRELFMDIDIPEPRVKLDANELEAGQNSITRQVRARGLDTRITNAMNVAWDVHISKMAGVFRWRDQRHLLLADNRTDDYSNSNADRRAFLQKLAWGEVET